MPNDWRLVYDGTNLSFGSPSSGYVFPTAPDLGTASLTNDDTARPRADGVAFGQDYRAGQTIVFAVDVVGDDSADARRHLGVLARAWRGDGLRNTPGAVAELVAHTGRSVFGRPRRFAPALDTLDDGLIPVTADFATVDDAWYGTEKRATVGLVPALGGGLVAPLASPLLTTASSNRSTGITVAGELDAWPVFEVFGPITNPVIEVVGGLRLEFALSLAYDQSLVVDTRPWARSALVAGASAGGTLTPTSTRLSRASISPGGHELVLRGRSTTGTARLTATWRPTYTTL